MQPFNKLCDYSLVYTNLTLFAQRSVITKELGWPIFLKGTRQTSHHRRSLSIIESPEKLKSILEVYATDPILRWQRAVCREYIPLRLVEESTGDRLPSAFEFRTFWWKSQFVGSGRYWWEGKEYRINQEDLTIGISLAKEAATKLNVPFLVVDIAQTNDGRWLIIECNDGQESGYGGISPVSLWQRIIDIERTKIDK